MTPYATFTYFGFLLYPLIPTLLLGLAGRLSRWFLLGVTLLMLALQYGVFFQIDVAVVTRQFWLVLAYALYQGLLVKAFLFVRTHHSARWVGSAAVVGSILPLAAVKFLPQSASLVGFLGISYLTFRSLDVLFGIQDGLIREIRLSDFWLFLLFFPTVASGPIDRYRRFQKDLEQKRTRVAYLQDLDGAIQRIFQGFLYKFITAYLIKKYWLDPYATYQGFWAVVSYMYAYSFYLFFDFAGYSAFAIGVSYLFGVHSPENFDRPFISQNIRDFWNRWHISLSFWFRDHVYMRFVMWATRRKLFANRYLVSYLGFVVSMGLMGVWHGIQLHYIIYGFYHAGLIIGFDLLSRWNKSHKVWGEGRIWRWLGVAVTFQLVCFGLLIFSGRLF